MSRRPHLLVPGGNGVYVALCGRSPVYHGTTDPKHATCRRCVERHMGREHGRKRAAAGAFGPTARDGVRVPGEVSGG